MYHFAGTAGLAAFGAGQALPHDGPLWLAARLLLDAAGGLFGLYLLAALGLWVAGIALRAGRNRGTAAPGGTAGPGGTGP